MEAPTQSALEIRASRSFSVRSILLAVAILATLPALVFSGILLVRYADSERIRGGGRYEADSVRRPL
jgi:hypothetical protein